MSFSVKRPKWFALLFFVILLSGCKKEAGNNEVKEQFSLLSPEHTGVHFTNNVTEDENNFIDLFNYAYNGGGVAVGDINNDGLADIYFTGNQVSDKLYLNQGGLKFKDISEMAGIHKIKGWRNGVAMVDINNDGHLDIYVCRGGWNDQMEDRKNLLYINDGNMHFTEQAAKYGLDDNGYSTQASFFDFDNDNDLDLYITNRPNTFFIPISHYLEQKEASKDMHRDKLYLNVNGKYIEKGKDIGLLPNYGYGLGVVTADINNDGFTDIYVTNDFAENDYLYMNNGDGTVTERIKSYTQHISFYAMGVDIADINNDGFEDIMVSEMLPSDYKRSKTTMAPMNRAGYQSLLDNGFHRQYMHNTLQLNRNGEIFSDIAEYAQVDKTDWSWACLLEDFDNDGYRDLFVANGIKRDVYDRDVKPKIEALIKKHKHKYKSWEELTDAIAPDIIKLYQTNKLVNGYFKNKGNLKFVDTGFESGIKIPTLSNGAATSDLDNDGDLDLIINNIDEPVHIYKNNTNNKKNYIRIKLEGPQQNPDGLGAKITLHAQNKMWYFQMKTTRGFLSSLEPIAHFGIGTVDAIDWLKVQWPDGRETFFKDIAVNQNLSVSYTASRERKNSVKDSLNLFHEKTTISFNEPYKHIENEFDDYNTQVLLPHQMSRKGPYIAVADINQDQLEDFFIGGAKGQLGVFYIQDKQGNFSKLQSKVLEQDKNFEDMESIFFDADNDGDMDLYVVSGGYEFEMRKGLYQDRLYINNGKGQFTKSHLPNMDFSGSCVTALDYDNDGDLDLFVGGHAIPGAYPYAEASVLLKNDNGNFKDLTFPEGIPFKNLGMVNTAIATDLENDGVLELVVAGEWMPIQVFRYETDHFTEVTKDYGLLQTNGWWNTLVGVDLDNDGDKDIIAGNLGENYKYKATKEKPFHVFAGDYDKNNNIDVFLAKELKGRQVPIRGKDCATEQLPNVSQRFKTYAEFADADIHQILSTPFNVPRIHLKVYTFSSLILWNRGGAFVQQKLPVEAQLSTLNGIIPVDVDGDGLLDLLGAGNNYDVEIETTRADASVGFLLKQHKKNDSISFESFKKSGIMLPYNVKQIKPIKLGVNAPFGFLVGSNNDTLRLFSTQKIKQ
ncbi:VCBS repeat-containing protein [uncultured Wocania sp.]|uniref:VCBS repeat-containing protein n=1 Tax=uncultured Wocania sp. TaxID=2834404 RepID=UPI0030F6CE89